MAMKHLPLNHELVGIVNRERLGVAKQVIKQTERG